MTFYVKSEAADGSLDCIPCFKPRQVFENLEDQRKLGRKAWVECTFDDLLGFPWKDPGPRPSANSLWLECFDGAG